MATTVPLTSRPAALPATQGALHAHVARALDELDARLRRAVAAVPADRMTVRPANGGWSVAEVLEHCCLSNEGYLAPLEAAVGAAAPSTAGDASGLAWRPTLLAGVLRRSLEMTIPLRAPRAIQPGPSPRADVLEALVSTHDRLRALMTRAVALPWRRVRIASPFAAVVRPNFGDACLIVLRHGERHARQIERTAAEVTGASPRA